MHKDAFINKFERIELVKKTIERVQVVTQVILESKNSFQKKINYIGDNFGWTLTRRIRGDCRSFENSRLQRLRKCHYARPDRRTYSFLKPFNSVHRYFCIVLIPKLKLGITSNLTVLFIIKE